MLLENLELEERREPGVLLLRDGSGMSAEQFCTTVVRTLPLERSRAIILSPLIWNAFSGLIAPHVTTRALLAHRLAISRRHR